MTKQAPKRVWAALREGTLYVTASTKRRLFECVADDDNVDAIACYILAPKPSRKVAGRGKR